MQGETEKSKSAKNINRQAGSLDLNNSKTQICLHTFYMTQFSVLIANRKFLGLGT
uniref:Uncharacterized protein n=1 Tax=Rhizophora mucronata TaxID=61149 RepID=A0A2P2NMI4_RHIMU